ncbi:phage tail protein [Niveispirillum sp. SYP-B3756]|nr:phage tail protein [Niveispirillum sp. SYP-B3756]
MMALGGFRFSLGTAAYQTLERSTEFRWAEQDRLGRGPAYQFVGLGADTITLAGVIYPHYRGGLGQVDAMRAEAAKGQPLDLVDGWGRVWGVWVIRSVRERDSNLMGNGAPLRIEFQVELAAYGEDA